MALQKNKPIKERPDEQPQVASGERDMSRSGPAPFFEVPFVFLMTLFLIQILLLLAPFFWFFELFTHYAHYYLLAAGTLGLFFIYKNCWCQLILTGLFIFLQIGTLQGYLIQNTNSLAEENLESVHVHSSETSQNLQNQNPNPTLSLLSQNLYFENTQSEEFISLIDETTPDIFLIIEANDIWQTEKEKLRANYPLLENTESMGIPGLVFGSKIPGTLNEITLAGQAAFHFRLAEEPIDIIAVHPQAPLSARFAAQRNQAFAELETLVLENKKQGQETLLIGDFNATPWSPQLKNLMTSAALHDARRQTQAGLSPTWHANNLLFQLPIDHALLTSGLSSKTFKTLPANNGDHLPIWVEFQVTSSN